jgi:hypothetical protein
MQYTLTLTGIVFLLIAALIIRSQICAKDCPRHVKITCVLAWLVAFACLGAGVFFIISGISS